jgi:hypothetical protein
MKLEVTKVSDYLPISKKELVIWLPNSNLNLSSTYYVLVITAKLK